jgi:hypothetical protein
MGKPLDTIFRDVSSRAEKAQTCCDCAPPGTRTPNSLIKTQLICRDQLGAHMQLRGTLASIWIMSRKLLCVMVGVSKR